GDEAAADPLVAGRLEFAFQPGRIGIAAADQPEAAMRAYRRRQRAAGHHAHRRQENRMPDSEPLRQLRLQHHFTPEPSIAPSRGSFIAGATSEASLMIPPKRRSFLVAWLSAMSRSRCSRNGLLNRSITVSR